MKNLVNGTQGRVAILLAGGIGDGLMFTPTLRLLKETYSNLKIDVVCRKAGVKGVFENNPFVNEVVGLEIPDVSVWKLLKQLPKVLKQIANLRKKSYDAVMVSFPAYRREYSILAWLLKSSFRIGHRYSKGFFSQFHWLYHHHEVFDESQHNVINNLNLLKAFQIDWRKKQRLEKLNYDLVLSKESLQEAESFLKEKEPQKKWIGIHPGSTGSSVALLRRWSVDRWREVIQYLVGKGYAVGVFIGREEVDLRESIFNDLKGSVYDLETLSLNQAIALVSQMKLMMTVDNGFGHVAAAVNCPLIALWGSTNPTWSSPWNPGRVKIIRKARWKPWFRYELKTQAPKGLKSGMEEISVKEVQQEVEKMDEIKV